MNIANENDSIQINEWNFIKQFIKDDEFPFLISFERTGSHWLRMLMELYFCKPSLVRLFYYKDATDFTCIHKHDQELKIERKNVIYLYRDPVDTVYSLLNYYKDCRNEQERMIYWADMYGRHLLKWLIDENFTRKKTLISYEGLKNNIEGEFAKICGHFQVDFDIDKLREAVSVVTKREVMTKTRHDTQVMNLSVEYENNRSNFRQNYSEKIYQRIYEKNKSFEKLFSV